MANLLEKTRSLNILKLTIIINRLFFLDCAKINFHCFRILKYFFQSLTLKLRNSLLSLLHIVHYLLKFQKILINQIFLFLLFVNFIDNFHNFLSLFLIKFVFYNKFLSWLCKFIVVKLSMIVEFLYTQLNWVQYSLWYKK